MTPPLTVRARRFQFVIAFSLLLFAVGQAVAESRRDHKQYDFHYDVRYPGQLRSDVGLDEEACWRAPGSKHQRVNATKET
jgi:hypothetical protein